MWGPWEGLLLFKTLLSFTHSYVEEHKLAPWKKMI
jgi:hypothetical protein